MRTPALIVSRPNQTEVGEVEVPSPRSGAGEALVRCHVTGISPGTELRCWNGQQPSTSFPFVPGYNGLGIVEEGDLLPRGTRVVSRGTTQMSGAHRLWGGHCAWHLGNAGTLVPVPDGVSDEDALMVQLAAIALRGLRLAEVEPNERVLVIGLGPVGQCSARLFAAHGAHVLGVDRVAARVELLERSGVAARRVEGELSDATRAVFPEGADIIVDCSGATSVALEAPALLPSVPWNEERCVSPRYVVQGSYAGQVAFDYHALFEREAKVLFPRDRKNEDLRAVLALIERQQLRLGDIIGRIASPGEADAVYGALRSGELLCAAFAWNS